MSDSIGLFHNFKDGTLSIPVVALAATEIDLYILNALRVRCKIRGLIVEP